MNGSFDLFKPATAPLPQGEQKIAEAEHMLQLGYTEIGQSLVGFQLFQCSWPHQVKASIGSSEEDQLEQFKSPNCSKVHSVKNPLKPGKTITTFNPYDDY
ncbi:hypothetical protein [Candidatus Nitrospira salsa]|nr:MAG: hypothetical protein NPIRA04_02340 [Nitrospirales bacterium]